MQIRWPTISKRPANQGLDWRIRYAARHNVDFELQGKQAFGVAIEDCNRAKCPSRWIHLQDQLTTGSLMPARRCNNCAKYVVKAQTEQQMMVSAAQRGVVWCGVLWWCGGGGVVVW